MSQIPTVQEKTHAKLLKIALVIVSVVAVLAVALDILVAKYEPNIFSGASITKSNGLSADEILEANPITKEGTPTAYACKQSFSPENTTNVVAGWNSISNNGKKTMLQEFSDESFFNNIIPSYDKAEKKLSMELIVNDNSERIGNVLEGVCITVICNGREISPSRTDGMDSEQVSYCADIDADFEGINPDDKIVVMVFNSYDGTIISYPFVASQAEY